MTSYSTREAAEAEATALLQILAETHDVSEWEASSQISCGRYLAYIAIDGVIALRERREQSGTWYEIERYGLIQDPGNKVFRTLVEAMDVAKEKIQETHNITKRGASKFFTSFGADDVIEEIRNTQDDRPELQKFAERSGPLWSYDPNTDVARCQNIRIQRHFDKGYICYIDGTKDMKGNWTEIAGHPTPLAALEASYSRFHKYSTDAHHMDGNILATLRSAQKRDLEG